MKRILFISFAFLFTFQLSAQRLYRFLGWQVKSIGATAGADKDMLRNMDRTYLIQTARGDISAFDDLDFGHQDVTSMLCENPHIRLEMAIAPLGSNNTEVRLAMLGIFNRIDAMTYFQSDGQGGSESLNIDTYSNEIALEGSFLKTTNRKGPFRLYGGIGTNLGYSFDGSVSVNHWKSSKTIEVGGQASDDPISYITTDSERTQQYFDQHNGISQRVFAHAGVGIRFFKRVELAAEYRRGIGYRAVFGAPVKATELRSGAVALRWLL